MSSQFLEPTLPMLRMEKPVPSWQAASAAAIFMGCCSNMSLPCRSPVMAVPAKEIMATTAPIRRERIQTAWSARSRPGMAASPGTTLPSAPRVSIPSCRRRHRWYQAMPSRKAPATARAPKMVCGTATRAVLLVKTAQASVITGRPLIISTPTGCCIQLFATMMK